MGFLMPATYLYIKFTTMNKFLFLVAALILVACSSTKQVATVDRAANALSSNMELKVPVASATSIATDVAFLASDDLEGRDTGSDGILKAASYLRERLENLGIKPYEGSYLDPFETEKVNGFNVVGMLPGSDGILKDEVIVIGAHYDHIGLIDAVEGDSIANGANDNATGTASVLAIAEILTKLDFNRRTVVFAFFSAEEKGLLGSKHLAAKMKAENKNVVAMINYEMTGVPMVDAPYIAYLTGYDTSNMGEVFNNANIKRIVTGKLEQAAQYQLYKRSDNYPFALEFNVPAQTFSTFDFTNFDHYHKVGDEIQHVNANHMAAVVDATIPGLLDIINKSLLKMKTP
jgi:hypothetical protein